MQDLEFTIERGKLFMLQTRIGKRTALASIRIAIDLVDEGMIDSNTALGRIDPDSLNQLLAPVFDPKEKASFKKDGKLMTKGLNAGPGAAAGRIALTADEAEELAKAGPVVLCRTETSPEDLAGMVAAKGILTARGGMTSPRGRRGPRHGQTLRLRRLRHHHRPQGPHPPDRRHHPQGRRLHLHRRLHRRSVRRQAQDFPSEVNQVLVEKKLKAEDSELFQRFMKIMTWSNAVRRLKVRTNADTPHDAEVARAFGAEGIGLCRTEHMFFEGDRIIAVREFILAKDLDARKEALKKLLPIQRADFEGIFEAMDGLPVTVRLLDPPLHEFVPHDEAGPGRNGQGHRRQPRGSQAPGRKAP